MSDEVRVGVGADATEALRRLLDERGVEWDYGITGASTTRFCTNGVDLTFTPMRGGLVCSTVLTPEQAIAATVGVGSNMREAIRKLLDKLSTELCYVGCGIECKTREERRRLIDAKKDKYAQAIAMMTGERNPDGLPVGLTVSNDGNLLNWMGENYVRQDAATVGAGTCHMKLLEDIHTRAYQDMYECDECGEQVLRETYMDKSEPPKFCPNCGRRCVG